MNFVKILLSGLILFTVLNCNNVTAFGKQKEFNKLLDNIKLFLKEDNKNISIVEYIRSNYSGDKLEDFGNTFFLCIDDEPYENDYAKHNLFANINRWISGGHSFYFNDGYNQKKGSTVILINNNNELPDILSPDYDKYKFCYNGAMKNLLNVRETHYQTNKDKIIDLALAYGDVSLATDQLFQAHYKLMDIITNDYYSHSDITKLLEQLELRDSLKVYNKKLDKITQDKSKCQENITYYLNLHKAYLDTTLFWLGKR